MTKLKVDPLVLLIIDGFGIGNDPAVDAIAQAKMPVWRALLERWPHTALEASGAAVGLPEGQMGNSEVGHLNIGAGQRVPQELPRINAALADGSFSQRPELQRALKLASSGRLHLMSLLGPGGVHANDQHLVALAEAAHQSGVRSIFVHLFLDGRDTPPRSAPAYLADLEQRLSAAAPSARIATISGRYFAMDRDQRWERTAVAVAAIVAGEGARALSAAAAIEAAYARGESDEFVTPTVLLAAEGEDPVMRSSDTVIHANFRADRAREILAALGQPEFTAFDTGKRPVWSAMLGMVEYSTGHNAYMATAFPKRVIVNCLGEWVAKQGRSQFRLAETEKYPHVTFFLNGGREIPFDGEERAMPASPKVATYDLQPEMSAAEVSDHLVSAIERGFDLIVVNFANPDMVGHTGSLPAAIKACEVVDAGLGRALAALQAKGGAMIVTADHGNCEMMVDPVTGGPHTAHTVNPVPVILVGGPKGATLRTGGRLADLAPTVLQLMGLPQPPEMTGESLIA